MVWTVCILLSCFCNIYYIIIGIVKIYYAITGACLTKNGIIDARGFSFYLTNFVLLFNVVALHNFKCLHLYTKRECNQGLVVMDF
jgi:hypothetical protein